jgi:hypothetical protein
VLAFSGIVCVAPLWLGGLRGKKSTPSVGWEVPVRSHRLASGSWMEHVHGRTMTSEHSHLAKVRLLKLLLAMKFNLHLFILLYSDEDFIAMRFPCTCISTVIVIPLSLDSFSKNPCYPQYPLFMSYCLFAWPE